MWGSCCMNNRSSGPSWCSQSEQVVESRWGIICLYSTSLLRFSNIYSVCSVHVWAMFLWYSLCSIKFFVEKVILQNMLVFWNCSEPEIGCWPFFCRFIRIYSVVMKKLHWPRVNECTLEFQNNRPGADLLFRAFFCSALSHWSWIIHVIVSPQLLSNLHFSLLFCFVLFCRAVAFSFLKRLI